MSYMPPQWKQWVIQCLLSGVPILDTVNTLLENGFSPDTIRGALGSNLPEDYAFSLDTPFYRQLADSRVTSHPQATKLASPDKLQLVAIEDFLSPQECQGIIELTRTRLSPSKLAGAASADNIRTSSTCELAFLEHPLVNDINQRIVDTLQLGVGETEVIQAQHYNVGEYYKPHFDFFPPGTPQYKTHCHKRGQRSWTCMIYLNDECEGGHTRFTKLNIAVKPQTGKALFWNNLLPNGDPNIHSIHFAEPVTKGHKTVITKWFRTANG